MTKSDVPESAGVFKPVGHVVIVFADQADLVETKDELSRRGFAGQDFTAYTPDEMKAQSEQHVNQAGMLASFGHELNLIKLYGELARQGHHFLVVFAPEDDQHSVVAEVAKQNGAKLAQKYNSLVIEELF